MPALHWSSVGSSPTRNVSDTFERIHTMKQMLVLCVVLSLAVMAFGQDANAPDSNRQDLSILQGRPEPPMLGPHWARGVPPMARALKGNNPNMTYHGGPIMTSTLSQAIFWGPNRANPSFGGDKINVLASWYA